MALHWRAEKTPKQKRARATKPSRAKRIGRRWDDRVRAMQEYFADRERAFRIVGYLAKRAERKATAAARVA